MKRLVVKDIKLLKYLKQYCKVECTKKRIYFDIEEKLIKIVKYKISLYIKLFYFFAI